MKQFYVYLHIKPNGDPFYVGKGFGNRAHSFSTRNEHHKRTVDKYGQENISTLIFPRESEEAAFTDEIKWIKTLREYGYDLANVTDGGEGISGFSHSESTKQKIGISNSGKSASEESKLKMSAKKLGNKFRQGKSATSETRAKMSASLKGRKLSADQCEKISIARKGIVFSAKHRANISKAQKGKKLSDEHRAKLSAAGMGKKHSPEARAKMSEIAKARACLTAPTQKKPIEPTGL